MPSLSRFSALLLALAWGFSLPLHAGWRVFTKPDDGLAESYTTSLSVGRGGDVYVAHSESDLVSVLNGYVVRTFRRPEEGRMELRRPRIYEDLTGGLWAVHPEGVQQYVNGSWRTYPVPEIRRALEARIMRRARQFPVAVEGVGRIIVLLEDQLFEYDTRAGRRTTLLRAADTPIGRFGELVVSAGGGGWIVGETGVARWPSGNLGRSLADAVEYVLVPEDGPYHNLMRATESSPGVLCMVALSRDNEQEWIVRLEDRNWSAVPSPMGPLRQVWQDGRGNFWLMTVSALSNWNPVSGEVLDMAEEGVSPGPFSEAVVFPDRSFFVTTPSGLWRHFEPSWSPPLNFPNLDSDIVDATMLRDGRLVFVTDAVLGVRATEAEGWRVVPLSGEIGDGIGNDARLLAVGNGLVLAAGDRLFTVNLETGGLEGSPWPRELTVRSLGRVGEWLAIGRGDVNETAEELILVDQDFEPVNVLPTPPAPLRDWGTIALQENGDVWMAVADDVLRLADGTWSEPRTNVVDTSRLVGVQLLHEFEDGMFWAATSNAVLERLGDRWESRFATERAITSMTLDAEGRRWLCDGNRLYSHHEGTWFAQGADQGLPDGGVGRVFSTRDGRVWVTAGPRLLRYDPGADTAPPITRLALERLPRQITVEESFELNVSGRDRWKATADERLLFSYRKDGETWSPFTASRLVEFGRNELTAGIHEFEVRSMDRNWNVDTSPERWELQVIVPWFREPRIIALAAIAGLATGVLAFLAFNRHRRLVHSYAEIEKIVAERTRQLEQANRELAHAEKMRALGTLAAGVAHDFNSLLSIIRGSAQIIEANPDNPAKIRTRVERIKSVVEQGTTLVKSMLGFSRADDRKLALDQPSGVLREVADLLGDRVPDDCRFELQIAEALPGVRGTAELLQQILVNLILNAVDAMDGRGVIVLRGRVVHELPDKLGLAPEPAERYVLVEVIDDGCGMTADTMSRIFEPFFTTKSFSTRHGTGLGLSMVYEFAKEMGYGLRAESEPGRGSIFTVILPVARREDD